MSTRAVMIGLLVESDEDKKGLYGGFVELGFTSPKIIHQFNTMPGKGGEGGRSDVLVEFDDKDIPKLAIHPMHLQGGFSWDDDYFRNNRELIPSESLQYFQKQVTEESPKVEVLKPECKLLEGDGNVFVLAGKVGKTLNRAGLGDRADEFYERLPRCDGYHEAINLMSEYVEIV